MIPVTEWKDEAADHPAEDARIIGGTPGNVFPVTVIRGVAGHKPAMFSQDGNPGEEWISRQQRQGEAEQRTKRSSRAPHERKPDTCDGQSQRQENGASVPAKHTVNEVADRFPYAYDRQGMEQGASPP